VDLADMSLAADYERVCRTPSDIWEHLPTLLSLVHRLRAEHVIELGTRSGVSTTALLYALEATGGRLTSIDIDPAPDIPPSDHWTFIQGDDLDPTVVAGLDEADLIFIDTSHEYLQTLRELNVYVNLIRKPGLIVLHDTELERPLGCPARPRFPVKTAVTEFCDENAYQWSNDPRCFGLGIIEVR
jgi:predicted O-methyltransferase YrrM